MDQRFENVSVRINDSVFRVLKFKKFGRSSATGAVRLSDCTMARDILKWSGQSDRFQTGSDLY